MLLLGPFFGAVMPEYSRLALLEKTEQRFPLSDERLIRFAATRPRWERREGRDSKLLLRSAFADVLPRSVTGFRPRPTGLTSDYFNKKLSVELPHTFATFPAQLALADFGIIDAKRFRAAVDGLRGGTTSAEERLPLFFTTHVESWLERT